MLKIISLTQLLISFVQPEVVVVEKAVTHTASTVGERNAITTTQDSASTVGSTNAITTTQDSARTVGDTNAITITQVSCNDLFEF